jgi:hypothetical protein
MATDITNAVRAQMAANATEDLVYLAQHGYGGEAGEKLMENLVSGVETSFGELEIRLAIGVVASTQKSIIERLEALDH